MTADHSFQKAEEARGALRIWLADYISHRDQSRWCGEFLDEAGWSNGQFGLGGTAFIAFLESSGWLGSQKFTGVFDLVVSCVNKTRKNSIEQSFIKDLDRFTCKAIAISLAPPGTNGVDAIISNITKKKGANGLVKAVLDDPDADGDPFVTAIVILFLQISNRISMYMHDVNGMVIELRRQISQDGLDLYERLLINTSLCCIDFAGSIGQQRKLLAELYLSKRDWHLAFSSNSPFIDKRFADRLAPRPRDRYVRVPIGFVVLVAIFMVVGNEKKFFNFPPVRKIVADIGRPFSAHVGKDRNKASVYYAFYTYISMHPDKFFRPAQEWGPRLFWERLKYYGLDLTWAGYAVVVFFLCGCAGLIYFSVDVILYGGFTAQLGNIMGAIGTTGGSLLGLFRTRKR